MLLAVICLVDRSKLGPEPEDIIASGNTGIMVGKVGHCGVEGFEKKNSLGADIHKIECGYGSTGKCVSNQNDTKGYTGDKGAQISDEAQQIWTQNKKDLESKQNVEAQKGKFSRAKEKEQVSMSFGVNGEVQNSDLTLCNNSHLRNDITSIQTKDQQEASRPKLLESERPLEKDVLQDQDNKQSTNSQSPSPNISGISSPKNDQISPQTDTQIINSLTTNPKLRNHSSSDSDQRSTTSPGSETSVRQQYTPESRVQTDSSLDSDMSFSRNFQSQKFCYSSPKGLCFDFEEDLWYHQRMGLIRSAEQQGKYFNIEILGFPFGPDEYGMIGNVICFGARLVVFDFYRLSLNGFSLMLKGKRVSFQINSQITTN